MYGTVARTQVKPENRDKLRDVIRQQAMDQVQGFVSGYVLWENEGNGAWIIAVFEDRAAYEKNADDPAQHERYLEYRALLDVEPEWHDGDIEKG